MAHQGYGFCEFLTEEDAEYACKIMNQIKLWGKPIRVNKVRDNFLLSFVVLARGFVLQQRPAMSEDKGQDSCPIRVPPRLESTPRTSSLTAFRLLSHSPGDLLGGIVPIRE